MVKIKAEKADKPRVVKTWRIRRDVLKQIKALCKYHNYAECEVIEEAILEYANSRINLK